MVLCKIKQISIDYTVKMKRIENLRKSIEQRMKLMKDKDKDTCKNKKLHKDIAVKEAEAVSTIDILEASDKVESKNKVLRAKVKEHEDKIIKTMKNNALEQAIEIKILKGVTETKRVNLKIRR